MEFERMRRRSNAVNLTPLVDVFFLLMIFFMVSTSFVQSESMELVLPGSGGPSADASDVLQMRVLNNNTILIDGEKYSINKLDRIVRDGISNNPDQKILLLSTPGITVQELVTVMDVIYINGGRNVQIDHFDNSNTDIGSDVQLSR
jgi:biopolymer transport protein ExbD